MLLYKPFLQKKGNYIFKMKIYIIHELLLYLFIYVNTYDAVFTYSCFNIEKNIAIRNYFIYLHFYHQCKVNKYHWLKKCMWCKYIDRILIFVGGKVLCHKVLSIKRSIFTHDLLWNAVCNTYEWKNTICCKSTNVKLP